MTANSNLLPGQAASHESALGPYARALSAHRTLVLACMALSLLGALAFVATREKKFEATTKVLVTPLPSTDTTYQGLQFLRDYGEATRTIQTAATLVDSTAAADATAKALGSPWTRRKVRDGVEVAPQGESSVLAITASAGSAQGAADLANTFAAQALRVREDAVRAEVVATINRLRARVDQLNASSNRAAAAQLVQQLNSLEAVAGGNDPTLSIAEKAAVPDQPVSARRAIILGLSLIAGLVFGAGLALLLELLNREVRDEDELLGILRLPVLARVPMLSRRERREARPTAVPPAVREAFRTLRVQLERRAGRRRTIMLTSASSGDGKTTSALNLALSLVGAGHRVLLIDFDLRKPDIGRILGIDTRKTLVGTLTGTPLSELVTTAPGVPMLKVIAAAAEEGDVALVESLRARLPSLLDEARSLADFIVVDTAPLGEVSDALTIADQADDIVVVVRPGHTNRVNLETVRDLLDSSGHDPAGLLVLGERTGGANTYYTYGAPRRRSIR